MTIVITMTKLIATMFLGILLNKVGILDDRTSRKISQLIIQVTNPLLIVASVSAAQGEDSGTVVSLLITGVVLYAVTPVLGYALARAFRVPKGQRALYMGAIVFANTGFMGYPVVQALYGNAAIFYTSILHMPFNFLFFTLQMALMRKSAEAEGQTDVLETDRNPGRRLRNIFNNGVIASLIALVLFFTGWPLPQVVGDTVAFIGNTTMPLSMLAIGSSIGAYRLKDRLGEKRAYGFTAIRRMICPLVMILIMRPFVSDPVILGIMTITVGMPIASLLAMGAAPYDNQRKTAAVLVAFSTLCSMISIPVLTMLL